MDKEQRIFKSDKEHELRASKDGDKMIVEGYGAVFNHKSRLIFDWEGVYNEIIREGAFDEVLASGDLDVLLTRDHDNGKILARLNREQDHATLSLSVDEKGLKYRAELPNTELARETFALIERGDLSESSFVFAIREEGQTWDFNGDEATRYIDNVAGLYDVSVVWKGAYSNTDIETAKRHFEDAKKVNDVIVSKEEEVNDSIDIEQEQDADKIRLHQIKKPGFMPGFLTFICDMLI